MPIVCTQGDVLADLIANRPLGIAVPPKDPQALAEAIRRAVDDEQFIAKCKENLAAVREEYQWERTLQPLMRFCQRVAGPAASRRTAPGRRGSGGNRDRTSRRPVVWTPLSLRSVAEG